MSILRITIYLSLFFISKIQAQDSIAIHFVDKGRNFTISEHISLENEVVNISKLKFYIGIIKENRIQYHLIDAFDSTTHNFPINFELNQEIYFGVDSLTNLTNSFPVDLDPLNGMYWSWQSGFINLKVEGKILKTNRKEQSFTYHIGGYRYPNNAFRKLPLPNNSKILSVDLYTLLNSLFSIKDYSIMSPGPKASLSSDYFLNSIKIYE